MTFSEVWILLGQSKDQIIAISGAVTAVCANTLAIYGVTKWRKEVLGKARIQAAQDVLRALYRVREAFKHVRGPAIYTGEFPPEMLDWTGHLKNEHRVDGTRHAYNSRLKVLDEAFSELEKQHIEAQVLLGAEIHDEIHPIRLCRIDLAIAIRDLLDSYSGERKLTVDQMTERDRKLYNNDVNSKHGQFTQEIHKAIGNYEKRFRGLMSSG